MKIIPKLIVLLLTVTGFQIPAHSQVGPTSFARAYRQKHEHAILDEFLKLLAFPNVASDQINLRRNADLIVDMMRRRNLKPRLLEAKNPQTPPAVYGEWTTQGAQRTIILYAHYDGQPTDPNRWQGSLPWEPVIRSASLQTGGILLKPTPEATPNPNWRIYARSSSDDKAGVIAILTAFDALQAQGIEPRSNLKFFFEGEEEAGSPHLAEIIERHQSLLQADAWLVCDGPVHQSGSKQVVFGVRGDTNVDLTVYGANRPLHSGHYGNWAPNPALLLSHLLSSMKDDEGRVTIEGWYDDVQPLGEAERLAIKESQDNNNRLKEALGLAWSEGGGKSLDELINLPSLNINGLNSGDVGALARNVIPTTATAVLDLRLVKGIDFNRQVRRLEDHIRRQGFFIVREEPTAEQRLRHAQIVKILHRPGGYNAERTPMNLPISKAVIAAVQSTSASPIIRLPTSGGSLPLSIISEKLKTVTITVPIANYDNNQHAENENIRLQNLWDGIETYAALMMMSF